MRTLYIILKYCNMGKNTQIIPVSAQGLTMPSISGADVKVSLGEIDALRASAANAIKVAQELEAQQKLVKIEVTESYEVREDGYTGIANNQLGYRRPTPGEWSALAGYKEPERGFSPSQWTKRKHVISVNVVNLEEVMGELAKEANFRLEETHKAEVTSLEQLNKTCQSKLEGANDKYYKAKARINDLVSQVDTKTREADGFSDVLDKLTEENKAIPQLRQDLVEAMRKETNILQAYNDLLTRKTFWGWVYSKVQ